MILAGRLLIALGFLAAALASVQTAANHVPWRIYLPALALGIAGVLVSRFSARRQAGHLPAIEENMKRLQQSLQRIVTNLRSFQAESAAEQSIDLHQRIDELFRDDLATFAENRTALQRRFGLQHYAQVMNHFAAGERYLNRVWSASVDGYLDEAREYVALAKAELESASVQVDNLLARSST